MPVSIEPLQPKDAIAYFRSKGLEPSFAWQDVWQEEHAKAFTVAKMMQPALLEDTRAIVDQALTEGWTLERFQKELKPRLQAAGWWGKQLMGDPLTGEVKLVQLGSDKRIRTIFATNMRVAYQVGNWQRAWRTREELPYMEFVHNSYIAPRAEHQAWDGTVLPIEDPWWDTHYPPCAWGCKCSTRSHSQDMLTARGLKVTARPVKFDPKVYTNPRTGEITEIERGIDPGWNYNVGKAPLRALASRPAPAPLGAFVHGQKRVAERVDGFLQATGASGGDRILKDADGWPRVIGPSLFQEVGGRLRVPRPDLMDELPLVAKALMKPQRAEWVWQELSAVVTPAVKAEVAAAVAEGAKARPGFVRAVLGKVQDWLADLSRAEGYDIGDFTHALDAKEVKHIFDRHGNPVIEAGKNQIAVVASDLVDIALIVARPDYMAFGLKDDRGEEVVAFVQRRPTDVIMYLANVRRGKWLLSAKSLWKFPAGSDVKRIKTSLELDAQNGGGAGSGLIDMAGKIKTDPLADRAQLIRRYTARLDKKTVTIDFSRDTWTFDVQ